MSYAIVYSDESLKQLKKIPKKDATRIVKKIETFSDEPRPFGYKKLEGFPNFYRLRVGDYRIVYQINDDKLFVLIIDVPNRRDAY